MTERAQTLAAAIREILNEFQYYQCCEEEDVEDMLVAIRERNQGIIFCSEKPKECAVEYTYLKLKETQK